MAPRSAKRTRSVRSSALLPASLTVLVLLGGYVTADLLDVAPGPLTLSEPWPDPEPFPTPNLPQAAPATVPGFDDSAPMPSKSAVSALIEAFRQDPSAGPQPGVMVVDAITGTVLGETDADVPKVPASTTKLLTAVGAIGAAGADHRFTTDVALGAVDDAEAVTIIGGGDLTLSEGMGDPDAVIGHGGVADLAAQTASELQRRGISSITDVVVDESLWEGPRIAPMWNQEELNLGWVIPMAPLALDLARIVEDGARSQEPGLDVGEVLREELTERGIEVSGQVRKGQAPREVKVIAQVRSAPLEQIAQYMLVHSDNVLAEGLGRLAALASGQPGSFEGAQQAITETLDGLGVDTTGLYLEDASGMSSTNRITPRMLVETMQAASADHPHLLAAVRGLPVAGLEGTLRDRMRETSAAGKVAAKTGSLIRVSTIAGQVHTDEGRILHVAVMSAGWESSPDEARAAIDRLLTGLAECGCS